MRAALEESARLIKSGTAPFAAASRCCGLLRALNGLAVITGSYPVTWITSLCEPSRDARLFDSSPAFRATGPQASHRAGSRHLLHYRKLTFAPRGATRQPTPQEGSHGTHS